MLDLAVCVCSVVFVIAYYVDCWMFWLNVAFVVGLGCFSVFVFLVIVCLI